MKGTTRFQGSDEATDLIRDVHFSWDSLRKAIDRRLIVALDQEAPQAERRYAAAWLAVMSLRAVSLDDDLSS